MPNRTLRPTPTSPQPLPTRKKLLARSRRNRRLKVAVAGMSATLAAGFVGHALLITPKTDTIQTTSRQVTSGVSHPAWTWTWPWPKHAHHHHGTPRPTATSTPTATTAPAETTAPASPAPPASTTKPASPPPSAGGSNAGSPGTTIPDAGVPAGITLKKLGEQTITKAGTVIDGADISGGVVVAAPNVVIKNSRVSGSGDWGVYVRSGSLTMEDTTITGFDNSVAGDNYTATRVEVTKANEDGFKIGSNVTIEDSYCHDLVVTAGAHSDCGQVQSGIRNVMIRGNWFDIGNGDGNSALFLAPDLGPSAPGPMVIENNVLGGGNFTVQCVDGDNGKYYIGGISIKNNAFLDNSNYGPLRINVPATVSGNFMLATKQAVTG